MDSSIAVLSPAIPTNPSVDYHDNSNISELCEDNSSQTLEILHESISRSSNDSFYSSAENQQQNVSIASAFTPVPCTTLAQESTNFIAFARFDQNPPASLRKSNFFNFTISLLDQFKRTVAVKSIEYLGPILSVNPSTLVPTGNGMAYQVELEWPEGSVVKQHQLVVRLVDSNTLEPIIYEGSDRNPDLRRVLVIHEMVCHRCSTGKSCGNQKEAPATPEIKNGYQMKFFFKCNQNCVTKVGCPREANPRRFLVEISLDGRSLGYSDKMFVHNSSKFGRTLNSKQSKVADNTTEPMIKCVTPASGPIHKYTEVVIVGENFFSGLEVVIDQICTIRAELISEHALKVEMPPLDNVKSVQLTLVHRGNTYCTNSPGRFFYEPPEESCNLDSAIDRLAKLVPRFATDPQMLSSDEILKRAAELLESMTQPDVNSHTPPISPDLKPNNLEPVSQPEYLFNPPQEWHYQKTIASTRSTLNNYRFTPYSGHTHLNTMTGPTNVLQGPLYVQYQTIVPPPPPMINHYEPYSSYFFAPSVNTCQSESTDTTTTTTSTLAPLCTSTSTTIEEIHK